MFGLFRKKQRPLVAQIPEIVEQLRQSGEDGNFVVFIFVPPGAPKDEAVNLQFSIENGMPGLDWVLIGPRNVADKAKVIELATKLGYVIEECQMNEVRYLRVISIGICDLGMKIIGDLYGIKPNAELEIITEGFKWLPME